MEVVGVGPSVARCQPGGSRDEHLPCDGLGEVEDRSLLLKMSGQLRRHALGAVFVEGRARLPRFPYGDLTRRLPSIPVGPDLDRAPHDLDVAVPAREALPGHSIVVPLGFETDGARGSFLVKPPVGRLDLDPDGVLRRRFLGWEWGGAGQPEQEGGYRQEGPEGRSGHGAVGTRASLRIICAPERQGSRGTHSSRRRPTLRTACTAR